MLMRHRLKNQQFKEKIMEVLSKIVVITMLTIFSLSGYTETKADITDCYNELDRLQYQICSIDRIAHICSSSKKKLDIKLLRKIDACHTFIEKKYGHYEPAFDLLTYNSLVSIFYGEKQKKCVPKVKFNNFATNIDASKCLNKSGRVAKCSCLKKHVIVPTDYSEKTKKYAALRELISTLVSVEETKALYSMINPDIDTSQICNLSGKMFSTCDKFQDYLLAYQEISKITFKEGDGVSKGEGIEKKVSNRDKVSRWKDFMDKISKSKPNGVRLFKYRKKFKNYDPVQYLSRLNIGRNNNANNTFSVGNDPICSATKSIGGVVCADYSKSLALQNLETQCGIAKKLKSNICAGTTKGINIPDDVIDLISKASLKDGENQKLMTELELTASNCNTKDSSFTPEENAARKFIKGRRLQRAISHLSELDIKEHDGDILGSTIPKSVDIEDKGILGNLKQAFNGYSPFEDKKNDNPNQNINPFESTSYQQQLVDSTDKPEVVKKSEKESDAEKEIEDKISKLEQQLREKSEQAKKEKEGSKKSKNIASEIKQLLAELKTAKSENAELKKKIENKTNADPVVPKQNSTESVAPSTTSRIGNNFVGGNAVGADSQAASAVRGPQVTSASETATRQAEVVGSSTASSSKSPNTSMTNARNLLSFSYQDFVKMDKENLFKESGGRSIEIVKKDDNGIAIKYILEPVLNEKGEFVDFTMVKKEAKEDEAKAKKKDSEEKEDKKESKEEGERAWYEKMLDLFKEKLF